MKRLLAAGLLVALVALSGCSVLGPSAPSDEQLNAEANYTWNASAKTSITVERSSFQTVISVRANRSEVRLYRRDSVGSEQPLPIEALRFRYDNGTVAGADAMEVSATRKRTVVALPNESGQVAFTAPRSGKRFATPVFVEGSHEVTLPGSARVGVPLLSQVSPGATSRSVQDDRMTLYWEEIEHGSLVVRYYLQRDLLLFGGLVAIAASIGVGGLLYYLRQIRKLERRREEIGLDVDTDEDDPTDRGPPPGMR